jgi:ApaG protein
MQGRYVMMGEDGVRYTVVIPAFALDVPVGRPPVH